MKKLKLNNITPKELKLTKKEISRLNRWEIARLKLSKGEMILCDVDDEIYLLKKRIQSKFDLTWAKARDSVNESIARLCCDCWNKRKMYGCGKKSNKKIKYLNKSKTQITQRR